MKKIYRLPILMMAVFLSAFVFVSCNDDDSDYDPFSEKDKVLLPIVEQYVNKTVIPTYNKLADATIVLVEKLQVLKDNKTDANVVAVAEAWIETRTHWELSEAFLFGAVADFGIDPHIDTWPLDQAALIQQLTNTGHIESMAGEDGDVWAGEHLGNALLGFHGIEFVIYKNGAPKTAAEISNNELIYAVAVAGDLRNRCVQLEASWAGIDHVSDYKAQLMEDLGFPITPSNTPLSYGENMLQAGLPGSTYRTVRNAAAQILDGAFTIADEVGNVKIGNAASGDDVNYIESPFSHNSLTDFKDNIRSIENTYYGGAYGVRGPSLSAYFEQNHSATHRAIKEAIEASYAAIEAIPAPFVQNYADPKADEAVVIIGETLAKALTEAEALIAAE